jgi:hypothetical protein
MKFRVDLTQHCIDGELAYIPEHYSIKYETQNDEGISSLLLNDLQLEIDTEGQVLWVYGLCPHTTWHNTLLEPPLFEPGSLFVETGDTIVPGISIRINKSKRWEVYADKNKGWLRIGESENNKTTIAVEFAKNCIAVIYENSLDAIWLHLPDSSFCSTTE